MSRLDSFRRRLSAQIDGLNWATAEIKKVPGDVLELGLGNGRTYDHLRENLPDRRIWVIERVLQCHPSSTPPDADLMLGEADTMLAKLAQRGTKMALAHYDLGKGIKAEDIAEGAAMSPLIGAVMAPGGLIVSQQPLIGFTGIRGPDTVDTERYLFYRFEG